MLFIPLSHHTLISFGRIFVDPTINHICFGLISVIPTINLEGMLVIHYLLIDLLF
ncbi:hypothetical protein Hanom_Chr01g00012041 [Helianthus anomalus]